MLDIDESCLPMHRLLQRHISPLMALLLNDILSLHYVEPSSTKEALLASVEACIIPDGADLNSSGAKRNDSNDGPIKPSVAANTGDRGNVHYAKELDEGRI